MTNEPTGETVDNSAGFFQAGAQRYAFEVDKAIDRSKFRVSVLSLRNLNSDEHFDDYYFSIHKELGSEIYFLDEVVKKEEYLNYSIRKLFLNRFSKRFLNNKLKERLTSFLEKRDRRKKRFNSFTRQFDVISWMGEYTIPHISRYLDYSIFNKSVIHLMNAKFQNLPFYHHFPKNIHYTFTSGFDDEKQVKHELEEFIDYTHILFPLYLHIEEKANNWKFEYKEKKKIGIFTRVNQTKPLYPFFAAFHLLRLKIPELELHIFGTGDPVHTGTQQIADNFYISDKVFFRGHHENIVQAPLEEKLDLVWFQGYKNRPAGYAGFDICTTGVPQLFWDFAYGAREFQNENLVYPHFTDLNLFVERSYELLVNELAAIDLSNRQFKDVTENRDMDKNIYKLEKVFLDIAAKSSS